MKMLNKSRKVILGATLFFVIPSIANAQAPVSGFFPKKNELTIASSYSYKDYNQFYRGTELTEGNPAGLGEISSSIVGLYGEYGIKNWLSTIVTMPYISVRSDTGAPDPVLGQNQTEGIQDLGMFVKAKAYEKNFKNTSKLTIGGATGVTVPIGNYEGIGILSLGNNATAVDGSALIQYTSKFKVFTELQAGYSLRSSGNYDVPNAILYSLKLGYFNDWIYAHAKLGIQNSTSGFDIGSDAFVAAGGPKALPQTQVDYTNLSFDVYTPVYKKVLGVSAGYGMNLDGRNYNKESSFSFGVVYKTY